MSYKHEEHFITLFDSKFLPMGLCLYRSMVEHAQPFQLWILCMDELVEQQLRQLDLPQVTLIPLRDIETPTLLHVKKKRTRGEYCWTLTPFTPEVVFDRHPDTVRVTYIDTDLFFFSPPAAFFEEFEASGKQVLITDHAYDPKHAHHEALHGRFCVQFVTFNRSPGAYKVMRQWQEQCIEWCYAREEDGKFGDQKYLDTWPVEFAGEVHILKQVQKTLAPWNVHYFTPQLLPGFRPVIYHFHALRIVSPNWVTLFEGYEIGVYGKTLYSVYIATLRQQVTLMRKHGMPLPCIPPHPETVAWLRYAKRILFGTMARAPLTPLISPFWSRSRAQQTMAG